MGGLNRPGKWKGGRKVICDSMPDLRLNHTMQYVVMNDNYPNTPKGTIVFLDLNDGTIKPRFKTNADELQWMYWTDVKYIEAEAHPSLIDRILMAIVGALWGYESHARNRYKP